MSTNDRPDNLTAGHPDQGPRQPLGEMPAGAFTAEEPYEKTRETAGNIRADISHGHETSDANVNALLTFAVSLVVTLLVVVGIAGLLFEFFRTQEDSGNAIIRNDSLQGSIEVDPNTIKQPVPAGPLLQPSPVHPIQDYQEMQALNDKNAIRANTYKTELMPDGKVHTHIPVEWAMKMMVSAGLPTTRATDVPVPVGNFRSAPIEYSPAGGPGAENNPDDQAYTTTQPAVMQ